MDADARRYLNQLSERVIGCALGVSRVLGPGLLEKAYPRAVAHELETAGSEVAVERSLDGIYTGTVAGPYCADLRVDNRPIVERKCVEAIADRRLAQTLNDLKATDLRRGFMVNFQKPRVRCGVWPTTSLPRSSAPIWD